MLRSCTLLSSNLVLVFLVWVWCVYVYMHMLVCGNIGRYWEEVAGMLTSTEKEMATVLLVFPELELFGNYELFEAYCER